ncbi:hypothetical protein VDG1235_1390 [Verrucomicrobiia bacterium DG1235]|nr:hypothetical protein VDG1235_1390 [Verrucomicrobiae bacterium DG1235]
MAGVEELARIEFRRRLVANAFPEFAALGPALKELKYVQADPIRSPARAQDLTLRQRVSGYREGDLEEQFPELDAEEGYLFAYGFMCPDVWQSLRFREGKRLSKREIAILETIGELGEAHPRDLDEHFGRRSVVNAWGGKSNETKRLLEELHHHGHLRVSRRDKGIRVYQVAEGGRASGSDPKRRFRHLVETTAHVFGPTSMRFLLSELSSHHHLTASRKERAEVVEDLVEEGRLSRVEVEGVKYLWIREAWQGSEYAERVRILAPFDPLVRDRERFEQVWDWSYRFEAYVPAAKRVRGYYAMPLLWGEKMIGWANAKVERERLKVEFGYVGKRPRSVSFKGLAELEVEAMGLFLGLGSGAWELEW